MKTQGGVCLTTHVEADYLVVGAGAMGLAFTDSVVRHSDATVAIVDRRHAPGGHWLDAYPFVRLHQASCFYGVASTLLGGGRLQTQGPEAGLQERALAPEICSYFSRVLEEMEATGRVRFFGGCDHVGGRRVVSRVSGSEYEFGSPTRIVNAHHLEPEIPATTPPPFGVADGVRVIPVNGLVRVADSPDQFVVVGSGKTATDACIWLMANGVDPDRICWVRPRDPWMLNRAFVQPDPVVFNGMAADIFESASEATDVNDLFLRMEDRGIMLRIDTTTTPTMAKTPTLATWELDRLRTIENVVRLGHIVSVEPGTLNFRDASVGIARDAVVVHCAASGLQYSPLVPIWQHDQITLQPVRTGFPCIGAAVTGYVEATRDDDREKNRICRPSPYANSPTDWCTMQIIGMESGAALSSEPDIRSWMNETPLNPARVPAERKDDPQVADVMDRLRRAVPAGAERLTAFAATR